MKLLGSAESKITNDKNSENVPHLEVAELVLVHCNLVNNDYQQDSRILFTFALKIAAATGDLVGKKIADKIKSSSKKSHNEEIQSNEVNNEIPKERYISPKERQQIIDELRLI